MSHAKDKDFSKSTVMIGALYAGLSVLLGAFAAHALKHIITPNQLDIFKTGVMYQMYHGLALLWLGVYVLNVSICRRCLSQVRMLWVVGVLLFSGSLYLYVLTGAKVLVKVTPVGGVSLILGWAFLLIKGINRDKKRFV